MRHTYPKYITNLSVMYTSLVYLDILPYHWFMFCYAIILRYTHHVMLCCVIKLRYTPCYLRYCYYAEIHTPCYVVFSRYARLSYYYGRPRSNNKNRNRYSVLIYLFTFSKCPFPSYPFGYSS